MEDLPDEIITDIYMKSDVNSIGRLRQTSTRLRSIGTDKIIDDELLKRFDRAKSILLNIIMNNDRYVTLTIRTDIYRLTLFINNKKSEYYRHIVYLKRGPDDVLSITNYMPKELMMNVIISLIDTYTSFILDTPISNDVSNIFNIPISNDVSNIFNFNRGYASRADIKVTDVNETLMRIIRLYNL